MCLIDFYLLNLGKIFKTLSHAAEFLFFSRFPSVRYTKFKMQETTSHTFSGEQRAASWLIWSVNDQKSFETWLITNPHLGSLWLWAAEYETRSEQRYIWTLMTFLSIIKLLTQQVQVSQCPPNNKGDISSIKKLESWIKQAHNHFVCFSQKHPQNHLMWKPDLKRKRWKPDFLVCAPIIYFTEFSVTNCDSVLTTRYKLKVMWH